MANGIGRFQHGDGDVAGLNGSLQPAVDDRPVEQNVYLCAS